MDMWRRTYERDQLGGPDSLNKGGNLAHGLAAEKVFGTLRLVQRKQLIEIGHQNCTTLIAESPVGHQPLGLGTNYVWGYKTNAERDRENRENPIRRDECRMIPDAELDFCTESGRGRRRALGAKGSRLKKPRPGR
jgi:hypothetical protein